MSKSKKSLEERVSILEERIKTFESIFSPNLIDRQTKHLNVQSKDARTVLEVGETYTITIDSPPGDGRAPEVGVGKICNVVTFVDCDYLRKPVTAGDKIHVEVSAVHESSAQAIAKSNAPKT